jgi:hypothetical protein
MAADSCESEGELSPCGESIATALWLRSVGASHASTGPVDRPTTPCQAANSFRFTGSCSTRSGPRVLRGPARRGSITRPS